jgi:hypothetical protein
MLVSSAPGWSPRAVEEEEEEEESKINEIKNKYFGIICIIFFHKKKLYTILIGKIFSYVLNILT